MILLYHKVAPQSPTMWWVEVDAFRRQMLQLRSRKVVFLDDYDPADPAQVVVTFDGIYRNILQFAAPILAELGYPFELFLSGDYVGRDNTFDTGEARAEFADARELSALVAAGGRLQWHGNAHVDLGRCEDPAQIRAELEIPAALRALDPAGFRWFGYPHGTFNEQVLREVRPRFSGALSCIQGNDHDRYCLNRLTVTGATVLPHPTVAVIIPCFNYGPYLGEAVESVLRQTYPPDEILISDDASTDETPLVMDILARRFGDRLRTNRNDSRLGIVAHFNKAVALTRSDYVCLLGADNRFRSDYLEHTAGCLDRNPGVGIAYTDFALFGPRAAVVAADFARTHRTRRVGDAFEVVEFPEFTAEARQRLDDANCMHGSSLFRRQAFAQAGGYSESERAEDWSLFRRMVAAGWDARRCALPLLEYRQHSRDQVNIKLAGEQQLQHYRQGYRDLQGEIARLNAEILRLRRTVSWRITAPLRVSWNLWRRFVAALRRAMARPPPPDAGG